MWVMCGARGKVRGQRGGQWTAEVWRTGVWASLTIWTRICLRLRWRQSVLQLQWEVQSFLQGISHYMALQPPHFRGPAYLHSLFHAFSLFSVSISLACLQFPVCHRTFAYVVFCLPVVGSLLFMSIGLLSVSLTRPQARDCIHLYMVTPTCRITEALSNIFGRK